MLRNFRQWRFEVARKPGVIHLAERSDAAKPTSTSDRPYGSRSRNLGSQPFHRCTRRHTKRRNSADYRAFIHALHTHTDERLSHEAHNSRESLFQDKIATFNVFSMHFGKASFAGFEDAIDALRVA